MGWTKRRDRLRPRERPLQSRTNRPIDQSVVLFTHPTLGSDDHLSVSAGYEPDGYRLVVDFPDGRQLVHRFFSRPDLYRGTARLQSELLDDGWQLAEPGHRSSPDLPSRRHDPRITEP